MKSKAERSIEALTWAAVIIWLGFALVTHLLGYVWLIVMVLGIILLSSAIYQRSRGWHTSLTLWVAGIWMAVFSVIEILGAFTSALNDGEGLQIDLWVYMGIALVSMGVAVVLRHINFPTISTTTGQRPERPGAQGAPSYIPRAVQEDYSVGYVPPTGQEDYSAGYAAGGSGGSWQPANQASAGYATGSSGSWPSADPASAGYSAGYNAQGQPAAQVPPAPPERYDPVWNNPAVAPSAPRPGQPSRPAARPRRTARPVDEPSDLESRVDDIIRRSRERRDVDNLPY